MKQAERTARQEMSANIAVERKMREEDAQALIDGIIGRNGEFFAKPENRLAFLKEQDGDSFLRIAQFVNAKLRGEKPYELRRDESGIGGTLPLDHTPSPEDKPKAFRRGFEAISEYLADSDDSLEQQIEKTAAACKTLIILVHLFKDGNGRTSRFVAELMRGGASPELLAETVSDRGGDYDYPRSIDTKESLYAVANSEAFLLDDEEREELRERADGLPNDIEGMYLNIKQILERSELLVAT